MRAFKDNIVITVRSGRGGNGSVAMRKLPQAYKMVPDGGCGGKGGDVVFVADNNVADLEVYCYNKVFEAKIGEIGGRSKCTGHNAPDLRLKVPPGTIITDVRTGLLIRQLMKPGEEVIVAKGGKGGLGSSIRVNKHEGHPGEEVQVALEYFMPADVFIVGYPNVGKSQFLQTLTGSRVKVTDHPFSTRIPFLGAFTGEGLERTIVFCEIPSIMDGSAEGKGIGNDSLKHLTHAKVIMYMLDPVSSFEADMREQYKALRKEIAAFDRSFNKTVQVIAVNKSDLADGDQLPKAVAELRKVAKTFVISSTTKDGVNDLVKYLRSLMPEE